MERWQPEEPLNSCRVVLLGQFPERRFFHGTQEVVESQRSLKSLRFLTLAGSSTENDCRKLTVSAVSAINARKQGMRIMVGCAPIANSEHIAAYDFLHPPGFTACGTNPAQPTGPRFANTSFPRNEGSVVTVIQNPIHPRNRRQSPRWGGTLAGASAVLSCRRIELSIRGASPASDRTCKVFIWASRRSLLAPLSSRRSLWGASFDWESDVSKIVFSDEEPFKNRWTHAHASR